MITLECTYAKKLGLPGYSSHQFSVTLRTEISGVSQVEQESARLYNLLQQGVDSSIQRIGFLPGQNGGKETATNGHGGSNGQPKALPAPATPDGWACSPKQRDLILQIIDDNRLDKQEIEALARERFNAPVKTLNKMQASNLIDELLGKYGKAKAKPTTSTGNGYGSSRYANNRSRA